MKYLLLTLLAFPFLSADMVRTDEETVLETETVAIRDTHIVLEPYFLPFLEKFEGRTLLDVGCSAAPWSMHAAAHGASVCALALQPEVLSEAAAAIGSADLSSHIDLVEGEATALPYDDCVFDGAISINGCNRISTENLAAHFQELARTLKPGSYAIVSFPSSLAQLFTNDSPPSPIQEVLNTLESDPSPEVIRSTLLEFSELMRAAFAVQNGRLTLITRSNQLTEGQQIWCKLPDDVESIIYHSEAAYRAAFVTARLAVTQTARPSHVIPHCSLSYACYPPYTLFHLYKP